MKVDNPRFDSCAFGEVRCHECPFTDEAGRLNPGMLELCEDFTGPNCPTIETYAEACALAEKDAIIATADELF